MDIKSLIKAKIDELINTYEEETKKKKVLTVLQRIREELAREGIIEIRDTPIIQERGEIQWNPEAASGYFEAPLGYRYEEIEELVEYLTKSWKIRDIYIMVSTSRLVGRIEKWNDISILWYYYDDYKAKIAIPILETTIDDVPIYIYIIAYIYAPTPDP